MDITNTGMAVTMDIGNPVAVRFGWSDSATPNFCNSAGLPSSSFRTDNSF